MKPGPLHVVRIETGRAGGVLAETGLDLLGRQTVSWHDAETGDVRIDEFFANEDDARAWLDELRPQLAAWLDKERHTVAVGRLANCDWSQSWKRFFHIQRVSDRIVVKPSWEPFTPRPGDCVLEIDPGMSFGTGRHATTRTCLRLIDRLAARRGAVPGSFLDLGCGSGILSLAAARLGFRPVLGVDNYPGALDVARSNARRNDCERSIDWRKDDAATLQVQTPYRVVAANILANVLEDGAERIGAAVAENGHLILSGVLSDQYPRVSRCYRRLGFAEEDALSEGEWTSGLLRKEPPADRAAGQRPDRA